MGQVSTLDRDGSFVRWLFDSLFASLEHSALCAEIFDGEEVDLLCSGTSRRNF